MINKSEIELLRGALETLEAGSAGLPEFTPQFDVDAVAEVLNSVAERMQDNYPYFHPQYAGQMLKPPHPVARLAYALSLWVNPNNHALDGGRASSAMEKECIAELGGLFGWDAPLGHLAGGGTMANLEALWVAGRLHSGKKILASTMSHYTHSRISEVLGLPYGGVATDASGRMDVAALEAALAKGDVGTVVATIGTTGLGTVDPLPEILALRERHDFRIHADAAYGGYFGLASEIDDATRQAIEALHEVDSIVIDPHKHGLQPYGCGCILFRDPSVGRFYQHDSPYTYFSSGDLHLGEITLECSRPGASAVALWATHRTRVPCLHLSSIRSWTSSSMRSTQRPRARRQEKPARYSRRQPGTSCTWH
jgi:tyrosine decarboxylase/aspartate 1-decarboxylase